MKSADEFVGMSKTRAQDMAEKRYWIFRLVSVDGERFLGYPEEGDVRDDRICVEVVDNVVTAARLN